MADDDQLRELARSIVTTAELEVDVESDLAHVRRRLSEVPDVIPTRRPQRRFVLAVAAGALLVLGAGVVVLSLRRDSGQIATTPESTVAQSPTTSPAPNSTAPIIEHAWRAVIEPSIARPGATITISPAGPIERICTNIVTVSRPATTGLVLEGQILTSGEWVRATAATPPTFPECIGDTTTEPLAVSLPADIAVGLHVVCIASGDDPAGCGELTVANTDPPGGTTKPPTTAPSASAFAFEPVDERVTIGYSTRLQSADFHPDTLVPFEGEVSGWGRTALDQFWVDDTETGEVVWFDAEGTLLGTTRIPTSIDGRTLHSVAVGPADTIYGLFLQITESGENVTVAAYDATHGGQPIRTWTVDGANCVEFCYLQSTAAGMAWEEHRVPYVDSAGQEIAGPALPIVPAFDTTWSASESASVPDTVDLRGPIETETSEPGTEPAWSLRINEIVFDSELGRGFHRQADGSFTTRVQLELERNVREHRHDVLLWLVQGRGVAAIDRGTIPGLTDVAGRADGTLIGLVRTVGGISVGPLTPRDTAACDIAVITRDLGPDSNVADERCDGAWAVVEGGNDASAENAIAHKIDGRWTQAVQAGRSAICSDDLVHRGAPSLIVDAVDWSCFSFDAEAITYRTEPATGALIPGDGGPRVRALQGELARQNYLTDDEVDGSFGPVTRDAIIDYQLASRLAATATADVETLRRLGLVADERSRAPALIASGASLGDAAIGQPASEVIAYLTNVLGPPDRDERFDIEFPVFSFCRDWQPRRLAWSDLVVEIAQFDLTTGAATAQPVLFSFSATSEQVEVVTSNGASVGQRLDEWTALHPGADVDLIGPVDWIGPIVTLEDGLIGYLDTDDENRVIGLTSTLTDVCDE